MRASFHEAGVFPAFKRAVYRLKLAHIGSIDRLLQRSCFNVETLLGIPNKGLRTLFFTTVNIC